MKIIDNILKKSNIDKILSLPDGKRIHLVGIEPEAQPFFSVLYALYNNKSIIVILPEEKNLYKIRKSLLFYKKLFNREDIEVIIFPDYDRDYFLPIEVHEDVLIDRIRSLWCLSSDRKYILITTVSAIVRRLISKEIFLKSCYKIGEGEEVGYDLLLEILRDNGYRLREEVKAYGEYSVKGGIIDFFSLAYDKPLRVQFCGDTIESIRFYDIRTQLSIDRIKECEILPCREFMISNTLKERFKDKLDAGKAVMSEEKIQLVERLYTEGYFPSYEDYLPIFFNNLSTIFDYANDSIGVLVEPEQSLGLIEKLYHDIEERKGRLVERQIIEFELSELFVDKVELLKFIEGSEVSLSAFLENVQCDRERVEYHIKAEGIKKFEGNIITFVKELKNNYRNKITSFIVFPKRDRFRRVLNALRDEQIGVVEDIGKIDDSDDSEGRIIFMEGDLAKGFLALDNGIAFYTEEDVFGEYKVIEKKYEIPLEVFQGDLGDLHDGDYVVHINHGIGIYRGLNSIKVGDKVSEVMKIEYADGDLLYLPVEHLNLVQKYHGAGDKEPTIDKLGSRSWEIKKKKAKKAIEGMVKELVELYAIRKAMKGIKFLPDDTMQKDFEAYFEYEETPDQLRAVEEVKRDMEAGVLMDRLICGDVGYGKTEVAMRAAFKAVMSGKQVALLAPTTVLAFQHYQTFKKRFEHFPVRVAMLSRLVDKRDAKLIIEDIYAGKIDIVIGTHRLLSKDVKFLDLGLLIIDEEQRFGVLHKEKLKSLYKDIDVLLLTATPIPRTLEMAFLGIRDMSVINTPPQDRLAVQTHVIKFNEEIIASAIEKELEREGQVFFIHNTIETIHLIEQLVRKLCPKARVISAHGKMQPKRIEDVMISFMNYEYDVLVCTTIIENGIDIPRANTIIINEADKFGLAQLYQLRGRVGRSSRRAYAYLVISERSFLSEMARKRLAALKEFSELGSGFRLAAADLQIRGAGNLLGKQQHGHIVELGFETYCNLLEEATKKMLNIPIKESIRPEIKIDLDFKIPEDYIPSDLIRMQFYKRIAKAESVQELNLIQDEMMDRFGKLPEAVENVLFIAKLGLIAKQKGLIKIMQKNNKIFLKWHLQIEEKMSNEIMINILKIAMNSSAQFLPDNSLMVPFSNYENVLNFVRQLPDFNMQ